MNFAKLTLALIFGSVASTCLLAQAGPQDRGSSGIEQTSFNETIKSTKKVGFRLKDWKTIHSESDADAQTNLQTLEKIGCEVVSADHGNHIDVRYRCPQWKAMELPSDQLATQWNQWLIDKGMETVIISPPPEAAGPKLQFRLVSQKKVHLHDPQQAKEIISTLQLIDVSVATAKHNDHIDATIHCPQWKSIQLPSAKNAAGWKSWLENAGFETRLSQ